MNVLTVSCSNRGKLVSDRYQETFMDFGAQKLLSIVSERHTVGIYSGFSFQFCKVCSTSNVYILYSS